jgi:RimJ/RimL family protein N-acetyltransferase
MEYRRLNQTDLESCYANRLRALEKAPSAFLTTLEEEKARGPAHLKKILSTEGHYNVIFGAIENGEVIGTCGIYREERPKLLHKALIWGMFVDEDYRGKSIGAKLLDLGVEHARDKMKASGVYLSCESANSKAIALYQSRSFRIWGTEPKAMTLNGSYFDESHMVLEF